MIRQERIAPMGKDGFEDQATILGKNSSPIIIDGGAFVGSATVRYREVFSAPRVFAFEPCVENYKVFLRHLEHAPNVELVRAALAEDDGDKGFYLNEYAPTHSLLPRPVNGKRYYPENASAKGKTSVRTVKLDSFLSSRDISAVDILKLDVQGSELNVLKGGSEALAAEVFGLLFLETNFVKLYENCALSHDISTYLADFGYSLFGMYDFEWARDGQVKFCNSLYISSELRKKYSEQSPQEP